LQDTILNGRYRLGEEIGEGGMSVVYRGHDLLLNRAVAIKVLRGQYASDESFLKRFEREAQSAAGLSHPNIVNVYDVGQDGSTHYIVMEYIRGPSLKELIRRQGPFSVDGAVFIISQVASALDYAHQRGLIHRDVKPQNILVDREGNAKVVDFGIAKGMRDVNLTEAGTGMGTVHYVSPEQARGEPATPQSDLYSTGVVLYEMLTKRLPFEADTPVGVAMQHVNTPPPRPSIYNPAIPPDVEGIVLRALAKEPHDRFPSGGALSSALRNWDAPPLPLQRGAGDTGAVTRVPSSGAGATSQRPAVVARPRPPVARTPARARRNGRAAPPADAYRDDVGCATWLIGSAILLGIVGLVLLAFKLGPNVFQESANDPLSTATVTIASAAGATPSEAPTTEPTVTATAPAPTATTAASPTIALTPTPETLPVPSLVNATLEQAQTAVAAGNWTLATTEDFSDTVAQGLIISQDPAAETQLRRGETINVVISKGKAAVAIPDVRGIAAGDAQAQLEALGFTVTHQEEASTSVEEGVVIRSEPDSSAPTGTDITLVVSLGDVVTVPDVFQADVQDAVAQLEEAGIVVRNVSGQSCAFIQRRDTEFDCDTFPDNGVVSGTLQWGAVVPRGSQIDIAYYDASQ
jgi:serine/threonine-protein kinase